MFSQRGEVAANAAEHDDAPLTAKTARDFLLYFDYAQVTLRLVVGLSRQLHRLPLWRKEFSRSPILFIPCTASSLRFSATDTTGENIVSRFTKRLIAFGRCQQPGPVWFLLIPASRLQPDALPFAWQICLSWLTSSGALSRGTRRTQSVKPILPQV